MGRRFVVPTEFRAVDKLSRVVGTMSTSVRVFADSAHARFARIERGFARIGSAAADFGKKMVITGAVIAAPLVVAAKDAVEFEDALADVGKTTQLEGDRLKKLGDNLVRMSGNTRTSVDDLLSIAEIGGQLGVPQAELISFTESVNKFNVALGSDFTGGVEEASSAIGKIKNLFETTRKVPIADAITKTGSAINELGAVGAGTSANIADFTQRMGALPDALKPSLTDVLALGTYLEEMGIDSQIASGGLSNFLLVAGKQIGGFAKQMKMSVGAAKSLLAEDPTEFTKKFAESLSGLSPDKLASVLHKLKIGSQESIKVLGALGSDIKRVGELENISAAAFEKGTSLQDEYNKKNATTAARVDIAKNNIKALSITLGNSLIPVVQDLIQAMYPVVQGLISWSQRNPELVSRIAKLAVGAVGLTFAISGISFAVAALSKLMYIGKAAMAVYNIALGITGALSGTASIAIGRSAVAIHAYKIATVIATAAQWLWNVALNANPLGLVVVAVLAVTAAIYGMTRALSTQSTAQNVANETASRARSNTIDQRFELMRLFHTLKTTKVGSDSYNDSLHELERIQPGIIDKYNLQAGALRNINLAERELTANILKRARAEVRLEQLKESIKKSEDLKAGGRTFLNNVVDFKGFDNALAEEQVKQQILVRQISADQREAINPEKDAQSNTETVNNNQTLSFDFSNMPSWLLPNLDGKPMGKTSMPTVGSTR